VSSRRSHLTLVVLIVLALCGVVFIAVPSSPAHRPLKQGLDLQGGLEYVLKAQPPKGVKLTAADLDRSVTIMRNRVDKLGVSEPIITKQGSDQISIQLAGVHDVNQAAKIIGSTAQLELYDLEPALVAPSTSASGPVATRSLYQLLSHVPTGANPGPASQYALFRPVSIPNGKKKPTIAFVRAAGPMGSLHRAENGNAGLLDPYKGKVPKGWKVLTVPNKTVLITCSAKTTVVCPGDPTGLPPAGKTDYYLFKKGSYPDDRYATDGKYPNMKGTELKLSGTRADIDPTQGPIVLMQFTGKGNKAFHEVTRNEATRGSIQGTEQHFAIVLDDEIRSWPSISYKDLPNGIDPTGSGAQITGLSSFNEASNLALVLQTGALPVNFVPLERTDVSATLGKDSLKQARNAAIGGLILVALFLLVLYRFLGVVAVVGLAIYGAFMYAAIVLLGVTLTLPGFAGLILTIGVAADANVVVFERIKEEARAGKSVRAAIAAGYAKGFRTILDANAVTAITALILFAVATAGVKGFALMLLIGTVISLITAVAATRAMLGLLAGFRWFQNPRFMGAGE
jgi:SecD/SecF fusion protein